MSRRDQVSFGLLGVIVLLMLWRPVGSLGLAVLCAALALGVVAAALWPASRAR